MLCNASAIHLNTYHVLADKSILHVILVTNIVQKELDDFIDTMWAILKSTIILIDTH